MPLAFSTLGAPDASLDEVTALARLNGATGVELRAAPGQVIAPDSSTAHRNEVRAHYEDAGIRILTVSSYVRVCAPGPDADTTAHLEDMIGLASSIGASYVRVFAGATEEAGDAIGISRLVPMAAIARDAGVEILLETHDSHPRGADVARLLTAVEAETGAGRFGAIWDLMHPWRSGEEPEETLAALTPWLRYVQFKDATRAGAVCGIGEGEIPLNRIATLLPDQGMWWSFEWEKAWHEHLAPLSEALPVAAEWYRERG